MSKKNRLKEYQRLVENGKNGRKPNLSQDDGSLVREFGDPQPKASESKSLKEAKK